MNKQRKKPDIETVKRTSAKVQEICKRADANILILDYIIAQLEEGIRQQPLQRYRLENAKQLLNIDSNQLTKTEINEIFET